MSQFCRKLSDVGLRARPSSEAPMLTTLFTSIEDATLLGSQSWYTGGYCAAVRRILRSLIHLRSEFVLLSLLVVTGLWCSASAQLSDTALSPDSAPLTAEQVVQNLVQMNIHRGQTLHAFQGTRIYRVEYQGFPGTRSAEMIVAAKYLSPGEKRIQHSIGDRVQTDHR
jgi:hypothetical protein